MKKVLIIQEKHYQRRWEEKLESKVIITRAQSIKEAEKILREKQVEKFDAVVVDARMPKETGSSARESTLQLLTKIRKEFKGRIVITSTTELYWKDEGMDNLCDGTCLEDALPEKLLRIFEENQKNMEARK